MNTKIDKVERVTSEKDSEIREKVELIEEELSFKCSIKELGNCKSTTDEQFDEVFSKLNDLDGRLSGLEEKELKGVVTEEDTTGKIYADNDQL